MSVPLYRRLLVLVLAVCVPLVAEEARRRITPEILHTVSLDGVRLNEIQWHPDGRRLTFLRDKSRLSAFDATTGRETVLLSAGESAPASFAGYRWSPRGREIVVSSGDDLYLMPVGGGVPQRLTHDAELEEFPDFSRDGSRLAYVRAGDLFVFDLHGRREWRLTQRSSRDVRNGRLDWVYEEELASRSGKAFWWSPTGRAIAYMQIDSSPSPLATLADLLAPAAPPLLQRFPAPGDPNPIPRLGLVTLEGQGRPGPEVLIPIRDAEYLVPLVTWAADGRHLVYQTLNRAQSRLELRRLDVERTLKTGQAAEQLILTEGGGQWINVIGPPLLLKDERTFLWLSERSGPRHLYRCTFGGKCESLTDGDASADQWVGVDETRDLAYFVAARPRARDRQLYTAALSGRRVTRLTPADGNHDVQLSPDGRACLDVFSTAELPPRVDVVTLPGLSRRTVEANSTPPIREYDVGTAQWVDIAAADGTPLHGRLSRPAGASAEAPRAAVVLVYGGPHGQLVRDRWANNAIERLLVSQGYVVWSLDNRGSGGRGHLFEAPLRGELGRTELADQLAGVEYLRTLPFVDGKRLGIYGASYGGYLALYAAIRAPDVFAAVVAAAPVTDWRRYDSIYTERYLGLPADNPTGYEKSSLLGGVAAIKARLLLMHGTRDDNVHVAHTLRLIGELHQAGIAHDLALHPGEAHGYVAPTSRIARDRAILAHFDRWLRD